MILEADSEDGRCFIMDLDRSEVSPPRTWLELIEKMNNLDAEMEREIDDLRRRYHTKRQPILDAKDQKRKSKQNF